MLVSLRVVSEFHILNIQRDFQAREKDRGNIYQYFTQRYRILQDEVQSFQVYFSLHLFISVYL